MDFKEFKILHKRFTEVLNSGKTADFEEYDDYLDARYENEYFSNWAIEQSLNEKNFDYSSFCCVVMANSISNSIDDSGNVKYDDAGVIMHKWEDGTFGIPIHDGGFSIIKIKYCPWCGSKLGDE